MDELELNKLLIKNKDRRRETALHEAGHIVMYGYYCKILDKNPDMRNAKLVTDPNEFSERRGYFNNSGFLDLAIAKRIFEPEVKDLFSWKKGDTFKKRFNFQIRYLLAGYVVDFLTNRDYFDYFDDFVKELIMYPSDNPFEDVNRAKEYINILFPSCEDEFMNDEIDPIIMLKFFNETKTDIEPQLEKINYVGEHLLEKGELDGDEILQMYSRLGLISKRWR